MKKQKGKLIKKAIIVLAILMTLTGCRIENTPAFNADDLSLITRDSYQGPIYRNVDFIDFCVSHCRRISFLLSKMSILSISAI